MNNELRIEDYEQNFTTYNSPFSIQFHYIPLAGKIKFWDGE